jgi:hypothetical protein
MKIFVGYLYFIQGIFLILPDTTCLLYDKFPEPHILSLFKLVGLPFSFKYLTGKKYKKQLRLSKRLQIVDMDEEKLGL